MRDGIGLMKKVLILLALFSVAVFAQQTTVAVLPSDGASLSSDELETLTDKMREAALKVLPTNVFVLLKQDVVVKRLGGAENYIKECKESSCIVNLGKKAQVDYVAKASVGKLDNEMWLKVELYNVSTEGMVGIFNDEAENVKGLRAIVENKAPEVFRKIPGASSGKAPIPVIAGGIGGIQTAGGYEFAGEKSYLANIITEPEDAVLSFNGVPNSRCAKTPCKVELAEGSVQIIANLEQYEITDTTVSIKQNNQSINIRLKPNFGVLEIKPAYSNGIGKNEQWSLAINGKKSSSLEKRLSPNKYNVELSHRCYEDISFEVGINKGKHENFDIASSMKLKEGGLILKAVRDGEPVSESVYVNSERVGETPFSGSVPVCSKVEVGGEKVDIELKHNGDVEHTVKIYSDHTRFGKIKYGIGGVFGIYGLDEIIFDNVGADTVGYSDMGGSLGMAMSIPIVSKLTFNPEFYLTYRRISNNGKCSPYDCDIEISELALEIPLIITLAWKSFIWVVPDEPYEMNAYLEAGASLGMPLSTSVRSSSGISIDREKYDLGFVLGAGYHLGDFSLGVRGNINSSYFDRNIGGKLFSVGITMRYLLGKSGPAVATSTASDAAPHYAPAVKSSGGMNGNVLTDLRDGKKYKTVKIGEQIWMAENLSYKVAGSRCYGENGTITVITAYSKEITLSDKEIQTVCSKYGRLYDWATAMGIDEKYNYDFWRGVWNESDNHQGLCPSGWHLPNDEEWNSLLRYVNGGKHLKATSGWHNSGNGKDTHGFSALPGGLGASGSFGNAGNQGYWWSSTEISTYYANGLYVYRDDETGYGTQMKSQMYSIRCVRN